MDAAVALNELKTAYWEYRTYRADLLPEVNFSATLPDYRKSYNLYQSEDGTYKYVRNNSLRVTGDVSIDQNIWLTGGKLSVNTSMQFVDPLNTPGANRYYMSVPVGVTLSQPIFSVAACQRKPEHRFAKQRKCRPDIRNRTGAPENGTNIGK